MRSLSPRTRAAPFWPLFIVMALAVGCSQKKTLVPFVFPVTPTQIITGNAVIFYQVADVAGTAVQVAFEVSKDGGRTYVDCTPLPGQPQLPIVIATPFGTP